MREGKLLKREMVGLDGDQFYVEKVAFKDWHVSLHNPDCVRSGNKRRSRRLVTQSRWDYVRGFGAPTVAPALRLPSGLSVPEGQVPLLFLC